MAAREGSVRTLSIVLKRLTSLLLLTAAGLAFVSPVYALSPIALRQQIDNNEKLTIIDIRPNAMYRKNHIQWSGFGNCQH